MLGRGGAPHTVRASAIPISVDFRGLEALAKPPRSSTRAAEIRHQLGDPRILMLGVDRLDYTKGIRHRLKAYEELSQDKATPPPDVTLVQVATPSRERVDAYRELRQQVEATVGRINGEYAPIGLPRRPLPAPLLPPRGDGGALPGRRRHARHPAA